MRLELHLTLRSDATFGRGDGVAGLLDEEVEHDAATGLPFIRGKTLKGLLAEECATILDALRRQNALSLRLLETERDFLFGRPGSTLADAARLHVGPALLPPVLRAAIEADVRLRPPRLTPADVLESLTAIRRQTAVDEQTGAPEEGSLRSMRVVLRGTSFSADLEFEEKPGPAALGLLAACVLAFRRGGTGRNRGRGRLSATLHQPGAGEVTLVHFAAFERTLKGRG